MKVPKWPSCLFRRLVPPSTYILRKLPLTYLIAVKMKMDGFLMCQEMFHASFSAEALINDYKCPHIGDISRGELTLPCNFPFEIQDKLKILTAGLCNHIC